MNWYLGFLCPFTQITEQPDKEFDTIWCDWSICTPWASYYISDVKLRGSVHAATITEWLALNPGGCPVQFASKLDCLLKTHCTFLLSVRCPCCCHRLYIRETWQRSAKVFYAHPENLLGMTLKSFVYKYRHYVSTSAVDLWTHNLVLCLLAPSLPCSSPSHYWSTHKYISEQRMRTTDTRPPSHHPKYLQWWRRKDNHPLPS